VLKSSLSLLWYEYLLVNKFTIPNGAWPQLEANLEARKPDGLKYVIPDLINIYLKAIILPMAVKAAKRLTETLHDMLFKQAHTPKTSTRGRTDLALCLLLILKMFLGRTQATLLLLARSPSHEIDTEYTLSDAEKTIREMETIGDHFTSLHQYTLTRRCKTSATSPEADSPLEAHARAFNLQGRLFQEVVKGYAHERPKSFEVGDLGDSFRYMNVRRLCWKVLTNMENCN